MAHGSVKSPLFRAFTHGVNAAGARFVREGFALNPADDLAFALGFPHAIGLVDTHEDESEQDAEKRNDAIVSKDYGFAMPASFASRRARALSVWKIEVGKKRAGVVDETIANDAPITDDEARAIIRKHVTATSYLAGGVQHEMVHLLEALVGPDIVLDEIFASLETLDAAALRDQRHVRTQVCRYIGFGLLRVPAAARENAVARATALIEKAGGVVAYSATHWLDVAVHGSAAMSRTPAPFIEFMFHVTDAPDVVTKAVLTEQIDPTYHPRARLAFLGTTDAVIDHYRANLKKVKDVTHLPPVARAFVRMRSDRALGLVLDLATTSKAKKEALAELVVHAAEVRPFLERTAASGGDAAAAAKAALAKLPK